MDERETKVAEKADLKKIGELNDQLRKIIYGLIDLEKNQAIRAALVHAQSLSISIMFEVEKETA